MSLFFLILSLVIILISYVINIFTIYKLIILIIGFLFLIISLILNKKINLFLKIYLPLLFFIFTYGIDYMNTYLRNNYAPIYVLENKINDKVSIYESFFYRIYKCDKEYIFDNNYEKSFACLPSLMTNIDINKLLNEPNESYKTYRKDFLKVTGKISRIAGTTEIDLQEYQVGDNNINGYVKFNENSKLKININDVDLSNYHIYDYITVVGKLDKWDKGHNTFEMNDAIIEDNALYNDYNLEVIMKNNCAQKLNLYVDNLYTKCISDVYVNYEVDKYELSYVLKDKKLSYEDFLKKSIVSKKSGIVVYEFPKFSIIECRDKRQIMLAKEEELDLNLCNND